MSVVQKVEAEKSLLKFRDVIKNHNEEALKNADHPRATYREPTAFIVICATAEKIVEEYLYCYNSAKPTFYEFNFIKPPVECGFLKTTI